MLTFSQENRKDVATDDLEGRVDSCERSPWFGICRTSAYRRALLKSRPSGRGPIPDIRPPGAGSTTTSGCGSTALAELKLN